MKSFNAPLLVEARLGLNLTQEQLAAAVGVDVRTYRRYESGEVNGQGAFSVRHPSRRRILARLAAELGVSEGELLLEVAAPVRAVEYGWTPRSLHALPRARHFVGREAELGSLEAWLDGRGPAARVAAIVALGGAGKTALVERLLASRGSTPRPGGCFVYSFYEDERVEAFLEQALAYFQGEKGALVAHDRVTALADALGAGARPHWLVLDGLEVVQGSGDGESTYGRIEDGALRRLLIAAARGLGNARVLVTSRFALSDLASEEGAGLWTLKLDPLSEADALALIGRFGVEAAPVRLRTLIERVGRHALSLSVCGSYAEHVLPLLDEPARLAALERLLEPDELAERARDDGHARRLLAILSEYARALSVEERDLLARLAVFPSGADGVVLSAIARAGGAVAGSLGGLDAAAIAARLARLERLGLLVSTDDRESFSLHPFVAEYFRSTLGVPEADLHAIERDRLAGRLDVHEAAPIERERLDAHELLLFHTLHAGEPEQAAQIYLRRLGGFSHLGLRLGAMSRGARILRGFAVEGDASRILSALSPERRARLLYDSGLFAGALGDLELARRCYRGYLALARELRRLDALSTGLRTLAYTERLAGSLAGALALAEAARDAAERAEAPDEQVRALALGASISHDLGRTEEAAREFARARALGDRPVARRALWEAEHLLESGRVDEAIALTTENLVELEALGWDGHAAHAHLVLGAAALARPPAEIPRAEQHLAAARRWTAKTGEVEVLLRAVELEVRLWYARGERAKAERILVAGRAQAEAAGFGWFTRRFDALARAIQA